MEKRLKIRSAAVEGRFYPQDPMELCETIRGFWDEVSDVAGGDPSQVVGYGSFLLSPS